MTQPARLLLLHGTSSIRATSEEEAVAALTPAEARLPRTVLTLDTRPFATAIASGFWPPVEAHVREFASRALAALDAQGFATVRYIGLDEVPTLVALGAFFGDEHRIECQDFDRGRSRFAWPVDHATVAWEATAAPGEVMAGTGDVVVRVMASGIVHDEHVDQAVPADQRIADISLRPKDVTPLPGLVQSQADVDALRHLFREVVAELERTRPGTQRIHLFLASPVSVCLAIGQELRLRNGRRFQTYRYRTNNAPPQTLAIALTPEAGAAVQAPLTEAERAQAEAVRALWCEALGQVVEHAQALRQGGWPDYLFPSLAGANVEPVRLAPIWELALVEHTISPDDAVEFRFDRTAQSWVVPNRMLLEMGAAVGVDDERVRRLARAFLWHEYLHEYQGLTEHTSPGIGAFANCLERLDYIADTYGTLHQVDYLLRNEGQAASEAQIRAFLVDSISEAIDAFWTFEPRPALPYWQARRLRRYLNWYWRREQIRGCPTLDGAIGLLCTPPTIEVVGPVVSTDSLRVILDLRRIRAERVELALVDESNRLRRFGDMPTLSVSRLLTAFREHDRGAIDAFFHALIDHARPLA